VKEPERSRVFDGRGPDPVVGQGAAAELRGLRSTAAVLGFYASRPPSVANTVGGWTAPCSCTDAARWDGDRVVAQEKIEGVLPWTAVLKPFFSQWIAKVEGLSLPLRRICCTADHTLSHFPLAE